MMLGVTAGACSPTELCQGACPTRACPTFSIHCVTNDSVPGAFLSLQNSEEKVKKVSLVCSKPGGRIITLLAPGQHRGQGFVTGDGTRMHARCGQGVPCCTREL